MRGHFYIYIPKSLETAFDAKQVDWLKKSAKAYMIVVGVYAETANPNAEKKSKIKRQDKTKIDLFIRDNLTGKNYKLIGFCLEVNKKTYKDDVKPYLHPDMKVFKNASEFLEWKEKKVKDDSDKNIQTNKIR